MMRYKIDVVKELSKRGYNSARIRKEKFLAESTVQKLRRGQGVSWENIDAICVMLRCQPGDILEVVISDEEKIKYF